MLALPGWSFSVPGKTGCIFEVVCTEVVLKTGKELSAPGVMTLYTLSAWPSSAVDNSSEFVCTCNRTLKALGYSCQEE